jgi:3',5'-nucleoside bisphosphate phosphatase
VQIDLHTHSTASDGTKTPRQVVQLAAAAGLDVLALTDHDSAAGWAEASAAIEAGVTLVPGIEISSKYDGAGVHLLAYLPDPTYQPLADELTLILAGRTGRLAGIIGRLRAAGVDISEAEVIQQVGASPAIGRPHVADVLVRKGFAHSRSEAFEHWLGAGRVGHVVRYATPTADMVRLITEAGGAAVVAHPWGRASRRVLDRRTIAALKDVGLVGLEVDHQDHTPEDRTRLRVIANELGLVVTGSSDFHGEGKVDHELGCNTTTQAEFERLVTAAASNAASAGRDVPAVVGT